MLVQARDVSDDLVVASAADLPFASEQFDLIVSGCDALNYLSPSDFRRFVTAASRCLAPDGALVFDYSTLFLLRTVWEDAIINESGQPFIQRIHRWNPDAMCASIEVGCIAEGQLLWREAHIQYSLETTDILRIAKDAGLVAKVARDIRSNGRPGPKTETAVFSFEKE